MKLRIGLEWFLKPDFEATVPCFVFDFTMARAYYESLESWMSEHSLIQTSVDIDAIWVNQLAPG